MAAYAFPKSARLLRRSDFLEARKTGSSFADGPLAASFRPRAAAPTRPGIAGGMARVGLTVSSKVGGAVARNRIKRRLRELWRARLETLPPDRDYVLIVRPGLTEAAEDRGAEWLGARVDEVLGKASV